MEETNDRTDKAMKTISLKNWEEFEAAISALFLEVEELERAKYPLKVSDPLFRGHACASWKLETTMDRMISSEYAMAEYYRVIRGVRPAIVSITGPHGRSLTHSARKGVIPFLWAMSL